MSRARLPLYSKIGFAVGVVGMLILIFMSGRGLPVWSAVGLLLLGASGVVKVLVMLALGEARIGPEQAALRAERPKAFYIKVFSYSAFVVVALIFCWYSLPA